MRRWLGIAGLVVWLTGTATVLGTLSWGVRTEAVDLRLADGTPIHGTLYRPARMKHPLPLVVLLHGTAMSHQSCAPGLAIPFAQNGYLALAIDLRGHGRSGGTVPRWQLERPGEMLQTLADHPEVDAAIDAIKRSPLFEPQWIIRLVDKPLSAEMRRGHPPLVPVQRVALVGHSRGGWVATNVGFRRDDVMGVVSVGAPPGTCDLRRPHNLLILTGGRDELFPTQRCTEAIAHATAGAIDSWEEPFGCVWLLTARQLMKVNGANHFTELANPWVTRRVIQWVASSLDADSGEVPAAWLLTLMTGLVLATLGGVAMCAWLLGALASSVPIAPDLPRFRVGLLGWFLALAALMVPAAAWLRGWVEIGPAYFLGPSLTLFTLVGLCAMLPRAQGTARPRPAAGLFSSWVKGLLLGMAALLLAAAWLGVPWGASWLNLLPEPRRCVLVLVLIPLLLPGGLALAHGFGRIAGGGRVHRLLRALSWSAVPVVLWYANRLAVIDSCQMFIIPVSAVAVSFLVPLPLWLLADRRGLTLARAVCHAGTLAWLLACHVPFVDRW